MNNGAPWWMVARQKAQISNMERELHQARHTIHEPPKKTSTKTCNGHKVGEIIKDVHDTEAKILYLDLEVVLITILNDPKSRNLLTWDMFWSAYG